MNREDVCDSLRVEWRARDLISLQTHERSNTISYRSPTRAHVRIDAESLDQVDIAVKAKGIAIDKHGKVWGIERGPNAKRGKDRTTRRD